MVQIWHVRTLRDVPTKLFVSILSLFELIIIFAFIFVFFIDIFINSLH